MKVKTNQREYSKYDPALRNLVVTVIDPVVGEDITVALVRADGFGDVATATIRTDVNIDSMTCSFDLAAPSSDGINYIVQGQYSVEARTSDWTVHSQPFPISIIPVAHFKQRYLFGLPLHTEFVLMPVQQPRVLGGQITYVHPGMMKEPGVLAYDATAQTISWNGGPAVPVEDGETMLLFTPEADSYLEYEPDLDALPGSDATELIVIDGWRLRDNDLRRYLSDAYAQVQQQIQVRLEATIVTTDPDYEDYRDIREERLAWERGHTRTIQLVTPAARPLLKVIKLTGFYSDQQVFRVPGNWLTVDETAAIIELLPTSGTPLIMTPMGSSIFGASATPVYGRRVPSFWDYTIVSGLRTLDDDGYSIREAIAKTAALNVLTDLSQAASGGRTSFSAQREGVSDSWNFSGEGVYAEKIKQYGDWLKEEMRNLRDYFAGINVVEL